MAAKNQKTGRKGQRNDSNRKKTQKGTVGRSVGGRGKGVPRKAMRLQKRLSQLNHNLNALRPIGEEGKKRYKGQERQLCRIVRPFAFSKRANGPKK